MVPTRPYRERMGKPQGWIRSAWRDARRLREHKGRWLALVAVGEGIAYMIALELNHSDWPVWQGVTTAATIIVGVGIAVALSFLGSLLMTPYREFKDALQRLEERVANIEAWPPSVEESAVLAELKKHKSYSKMLEARSPSLLAEGQAPDGVSEEVDAWEQRVAETLADDEDLAKQFLSQRPPVVGESILNELHMRITHRRNMLDRIISHLESGS